MLFGGNADPGVGDRKAQPHVAVRPVFELDAEHDLTLFRKLDRVADKIDDDLTQAAGIAHESIRNIGANVAGQFELLLMSPLGENPERVLESVAQVELDAIEIELARLDLGEIKDVIDQRQ